MDKILKSGKWLYAYSFSFYVFLHLALADVGVDRYVPKYLPFPYFINYLTGICIFAFIVSVTIGKYDKLASILLAVYLLLVAVMIHLPYSKDPMEMLNVFRVVNMIGGAFMYAVGFAKDKRLVG
ncbi:MAG: hypothetical protein LW821_15890 [Flammeovirgaceae bacterium]|jgi:uncharacterized membrane protein YphA (DoxX/SURF4 family)|nr:hypothetical protein [Flammeovirgaceae bacterium]